MSAETLPADIHLRQIGICDPAVLNSEIFSTTVIGAGGISSSVVLAISKMGLRNITVWDHDDLEDHNLGNQFLPYRIGGETFLRRKKVRALEALIKTMVPRQSILDRHPIITEPRWFTSESTLSWLTISGVDSMKARKMIWERVKRGPCEWYIDGRMAAQQLDIYIVHMEDPKNIELYEASLFDDEDGLEEPCTARGIVFTSMLAGGHIANIVKKIAVGPPPPMRLIHIIEHDIISVVRR